jgi:hypothetical protein
VEFKSLPEKQCTPFEAASFSFFVNLPAIGGHGAHENANLGANILQG